MVNAQVESSTGSGEFDPEPVAGYIYVRALRYAMSDTADIDDLQQEGMIAAWQAIDTFKPEKGIPFKSWQMRSIDFAMFETRYRGTWTGMPPRSKNGGSSVKHKAVLVAEWLPELEPSIAGPEIHTMWVYHRSELINAIKALTPDQQEYVFLRFWFDMKPRELKEYFPQYSNPDSLWFGDYGARTKLRKALEHLKEESEH